jgi:hypothetical protein
MSLFGSSGALVFCILFQNLLGGVGVFLDNEAQGGQCGTAFFPVKVVAAVALKARFVAVNYLLDHLPLDAPFRWVREGVRWWPPRCALGGRLFLFVRLLFGILGSIGRCRGSHWQNAHCPSTRVFFNH